MTYLSYPQSIKSIIFQKYFTDIKNENGLCKVNLSEEKFSFPMEDI